MIGYHTHTERHDLPDISSGDSFSRTVGVRANGVVPDGAEDWSIAFVVKENVSDTREEALIENVQSVDEETGEVVVEISSTKTADFDGGKWYSISVEDQNGGVQTLAKGRVYFEEDI
jgi:hypothetical protein